MWGLKSASSWAPSTRRGQRMLSAWLQRCSDAVQPETKGGRGDTASTSCLISRPASGGSATRPRATVVARAAAAAAPSSSPEPSPSTSEASKQQVNFDLDYVPSLGPALEFLSVLLPVLACLVLYKTTGRWHGGALAAKLGAVLAAAAGASLTRAALLEREYKARERAFSALGDPDSHFRRIGELGVHVKAKAADPAVLRAAAQAGELTAAHCYHGFGANLASYGLVQARLAAALAGVVTAHDMPGFGLTERPPDMSAYYLTYNGRLGRLVMDAELRAMGLEGAGGAGSAEAGPGAPSLSGTARTPKTGSPREQQAGSAADPGAAVPGGSASGGLRRILIGHSLGGACAALEAVTHPEGLAALVLVAPAIFAFPGPDYAGVTLTPDRPPPQAATAAGAATAPADAASTAAAAARAALQLGPEPPGSHVTDPPTVRRLYPRTSGAAAPGGRTGGKAAQRGGVLRALRAGLAALASALLLLVLRLLAPIITALLRSLVRRRAFWHKGLQQAYYDPALVTPAIVDAYRLPQLVRGWEGGMVNFLLARLAGSRARLSFRPEQGPGPGGPVTGSAAVAEALAASEADTEAAAAARASAPPAADGAAAGPEPAHADDDDLASRLSALVASRRLPVLLVHGLQDRLVPASNSQRLARMLPGCELVLLDRCGHMPQEEAPELFVDLVADFAAGVAGGGGGGGAARAEAGGSA
ncbi:hypothetical protein HYH03_009037 [Edaphochlamys debaryana]|uniref:AB hydrolase-1 domain-containing protein n=1 Tax=Edaphochlamys debaryana TaxID=47281 RepID=A0A835Y200_9CHLO|nr:hypothetical protein HYH03_009037 [Edaphochlamys debaryana]|eukprot:KAG2492621.1 hypothetical protein HYH03_009037 [Edaphochlamys debaryana]